MLKIDVDIAKALREMGDALDAVSDSNVRAGLRAGAERATDVARGYAPVDTGRLQRSIKVAEVTGDHAKVHADPGDYPEAYYAIFQEYGTYKMAAQPFMRPTVDMHGDEIAGEVLNAIKKKLP